MIKTLDRLIVPITVILAFLAVIPLGSNRPWSWLLLGLLSIIIVSAQLVVDFSQTKRASKQFQNLGPIPWLMLGLILWICIQASGLPPTALHHPIYQDLPGTLYFSAISITPEISVHYALRFISYCCFFWIAYRQCHNLPDTERLIHWLLWGYAAIFLYAILTFLTGQYKTQVLWLPNPWSSGGISGTFVNPNHFGAYSALGGLLAACQLKLATNSLGLSGVYDRKVALKILLSESSHPRIAVPTSIFVIATITVLLTNSRGAVISYMFGLFMFFFVFQGKWFARKFLRPFQSLPTIGRTVVILAALILLIGLYYLPFVQTSLSTIDNVRAEIAVAIALAIADNAIIGTGAGSFEHAFQPYRGEFQPGVTFKYAHNSILQNALELGIVGMIFLYIALAMIFEKLQSGAAIRKRAKPIAALGISVILTATLHSLVDFAYEIPAITAMFSIILGMCIGAIGSDTRGNVEPSDHRK
ncbi:MAG: O-antigen ligase family protein [Alphaproteobacteria bacterium]